MTAYLGHYQPHNGIINMPHPILCNHHSQQTLHIHHSQSPMLDSVKRPNQHFHGL